MTEDQPAADPRWGDRIAEAHQALRTMVGDAVRAAVLDDLGPAATFTTQMRQHCEVACTYLHGHHTSEDSLIFPHLRSTHPALASALDRLQADHRDIEGRLAEVEAAMADDDATRLHPRLADLERLLDTHFTAEEKDLVGPLNELTGPVPWDQ